MSVLIKGMEMPKNCDACPMLFEYRFCSLTDDHASSIEWKTEEKRMPNCPLIELPDHGDLIDRDAFRKAMYHDTFETDSDLQKWESGCWIRYKMFERNIESAPVVIPAERDVKVCPLYSDDEVTEYCVEGPCTDEMEGRCPIAERSEE